ncbi:hypothetical protein ACNJYG_01605 [Pseudomonas sp. GW6]|nr:hypothetical protein [Pseudomonas chengduensis]MDH1870006.1 hypothetical protein [Pseudomonas chengduensis]
MESADKVKPMSPCRQAAENVGEAGNTKQKLPKKGSLAVLNEHFEAVFNAVVPTQVVFGGLSAGVI